MHKNIKIKNKQGFTLVELMLYIVITTGIIFSFIAFLQTILEARVKNQTIAEVEQNGMQIIQIINQTVRNATAITTPLQGATGATLTLTVPMGVNSPTIFDLLTGNLRIKEGTGANIALSSPRITVSGLSFQNVTRGGTPGSVKYQFTVTYVNPSGKNEYNFTRTFYASASVRD